MAEAIGLVASVLQLVDTSVKVIDYVSSVKNAQDEANKIKDEVSSAVVLLSRLQVRLQNPDADTLWVKEVSSSLRSNLDQVQKELQRIADKLAPPGSGATRFLVKLQWPFRKEDIDISLSRVARLNTLVQVALQENQNTLAEAIKKDTTSIRDDIQDITRKSTTIIDYAEQQRHDQIIDFLAPHQYSIKYSEILSARHLGTGKWFLGNPIFQDWLHEVGSTIWCPGMPGAGKTTIMTTVIEHLAINFASDPEVAVVYCFCDYLERGQNALSITSSLWRQLISKRVLLAYEYTNLRNQYLDHGRRPANDEMLAMLHEELSRFSRVYLLIDALDEISAEHRESLISSLSELEPNTNLFFTSRIVQDIADRFKKLQRLEIAANSQDLHKYINGRISAERRLSQHVAKDKKLALDIEAQIIKRSEGMFLLAKLHMDSLATKATAKAVRKALTSLPSGDDALKETYESALRRIEGQNPDDRQLAERVIMWIRYSFRPLTIIELRCALSIEPGDEEMGEDLVEEDLILEICAGLVIVDQKSSTVRFVHYTTQEYFEANTLNASPSAHEYLAKTCVAFLSLNMFNVEPKDQKIWHVNRKIENVPFLSYTACQWGNHARLVFQSKASNAESDHPADQSQKSFMQYLRDAPDIRGLRDLIQNFSSLPNQVTHALRVYMRENVIHGSRIPNREDVNAKDQLNILAAFGLDELVEECLNSGIDNLGISDKNSLGNALHWAVVGNHESTINLVLGRGNVSKQHASYGFEYFNPLQLAALHGRDDAVRLLLRFGADVEVPTLSNTGFYPLQLASQGGSLGIVNMFLESEAGRGTVLLRDSRGRTAPHYAVLGQNAEVMQVLLQEIDKIDVSTQKKVELLTDDMGRNALHTSAYGGLTNMVTTILQSTLGAQLASHKSSVAIHMVYDTKTDSAPVPGDVIGGMIPFQEAASAGHEDTTKRFLEWDNWSLLRSSPDLIKATAFEAAFRGRSAVLNLLLDYLPSVSLKNEHGVSLLHYAADSGSVETVKTVLSRDCDGELLESRDDEDETPFMRAAYCGMIEVCTFLLDQGCDMHAVDHDGDTVLHFAAFENLTAMLEMLIARGGKLDVKNKDGATPLAAAVESKSLQAAQVLLAAGASVVEIPSEPQSEDDKDSETPVQDFRAKVAMLSTRPWKRYPAGQRDQFEAFFYLKMAFNCNPPSQLVARILDTAEYWVLSKSQRAEWVIITEGLGDTINYLRSLPLIGCPQRPVRRVIFRISSYDQGNSQDLRCHGTYLNSRSWFAAARETRSSSSSATDGNAIDRIIGPPILCNVHASDEERTHEVCWPAVAAADMAPNIFGDPPGFHWYHNRVEVEVERWIAELQPGDRVCIVPIANFNGWENNVIRADIEVYSSFICPGVCYWLSPLGQLYIEYEFSRTHDYRASSMVKKCDYVIIRTLTKSKNRFQTNSRQYLFRH